MIATVVAGRQLGGDARMTSAGGGQPMLLSTRADYASFNGWLRSNVAPWNHPAR